jgi:hypothetical protein
MKKIFMVLPAFALALALAAPVSAWWMPSNDELKVSSSNNAAVVNATTATSKTGGNTTLFNKGMMSGNISTGSAGSIAESHLTLNGNATGISAPCNNCYDDVTVKSKNNAFVMNTTNATSMTGGNKTVGNGGYVFGGGSGNVASGAAESAAGSWLVVNSNITSLGGGN